MHVTKTYAYAFNTGEFNGLVEVELTEVGKRCLQDHHPQGIVWEYDPDKPFKLYSVATDFVELTYLGIPYRIPSRIDGKLTIKKAVQSGKVDNVCVRF